ncbi:hypothetical protein BGK67_24235 [Streptomyces subrutilus]|uniref:Uncharacterized protein n=1 Tax=Streptomyces subrutilus TaxID=36818 RepID=A0A1E5PXE7_9ACTN|nr:hypothetical protein BGK67_24235 [Streptomyces subrutilus]
MAVIVASAGSSALSRSPGVQGLRHAGVRDQGSGAALAEPARHAVRRGLRPALGGARFGTQVVR